MYKRITSWILAFVILGSLFATILPVEAEAAVSKSTYEQRVSEFLADSRWKHGSIWNANQKPKISNWDSYGCCAYCADFVAYVYGEKSAPKVTNLFTAFYDINEVRAGDIIQMDGHWLVVLGRTGNKLYTAEGNIVYNKDKPNEVRKVRVSEKCWTITSGKFCNNDVSSKPKLSLIVGYHYNFADSDASVSFSDYPEKTKIYGGSANLGITLNKPKGVSVTKYGLRVYDSHGNLLKDKSFKPQSNYSSNLYLNIDLHTRDDLGIELYYGTVYQYQYYATVGGKTYTSAMRNFRTHYFIRFKANGGTGTMDTIYVHNGKSVALTKNAFTRSGYTFKGWNARRTDGKWYVGGKGWFTEEEIAANGYTKRLYEDGFKVAMGKAWHEEIEGVCFEMYAVWEANNHQHSYTAAVTAPTCTKDGYTTHTCSCGASYTDSTVAALGHSFGLWYQTVAPTETAEGEERRDCARCDAFETRKLDKAPHEHLYLTENFAPTCTQWGYTTNDCACGHSFVEYNLPSLGHNFGQWYQTVAPTQTTEGQERRDCDRCGEYETRVIPVLQLEHVYAPEVIAPTCTQEGYTLHSCAHCGDSYTDSYVEALGHKYGQWRKDRTQRADYSRMCTRCLSRQNANKDDNPFTDVGEGNRFKTAILWAYYNNITTGKTETTFAPNGEVTRAQVVTFLWRAAGSPEPASSDNPFTDVPDGKYFTKAVLWAVEKGITKGTGDGTTFEPNTICNRGQVVMFLYRFAGQPEIGDVENPFTDVNERNTFYKAIMWAKSEGITSGKTATTFEIKSLCQRYQAVTFLYKLLG